MEFGGERKAATVRNKKLEYWPAYTEIGIYNVPADFELLLLASKQRFESFLFVPERKELFESSSSFSSVAEKDLWLEFGFGSERRIQLRLLASGKI